jgi:RNA polymerase sigma-70 factor (ECF subfamily)
MTDPASDEISNELLLRVRRHSSEAFETLYLRCSRRLYGFFLTLLANRAEAEDLTQETFVRLWEKRRLYKPTERPQVYVFSIARNLYIDRIRALKIRSDRRPPQIPPAAGPEHEESLSELQRALLHGLHELDPELREVYLMSRQEGLAYREIASILGLSVKTIESRMQRTLESLRKFMAPYLEGFYSS